MSLATLLLAALTSAVAVHFPVSSSDPQLQATIDRGLFLYYAYDGDDAARAFAQAAARDPRLAIAYWGIALADGPDLNTPPAPERFDLAAKAIRTAVALAPSASPLERQLVSIMALRYRGSFADAQRNETAYREAMVAYAESSQDENVQLLAAEALLEYGGLAWEHDAPASPESRRALDFVAGVLESDPANPMPNHLCIHLYDLAPDRSAALACARRLDATAFPPEAEHLAHMPAHYWIETGDYQAAIVSSERAYGLLQQLNAGGRGDRAPKYAKHDVTVGYSAAMMRGSYATAQLWAVRMATVFGVRFDALTALRFGRDAAAYAADGNQFGNPSVRGLAAIALGRLTEARAIAARVRTGNTSLGYLPQLFLARLAEVDGDEDEAIRWDELAVRNQHGDFAGEMIPFLPAQEALGRLYLRRGRNAEATVAFNAALAAYPNDPRALFGLAAALTADGKNAQAAAARARFNAYWGGADTSLDGAAIK
ncbi:MAG: tetratricopeptide repeat protein [Candidatus Baltobacteraceae bacterium]